MKMNSSHLVGNVYVEGVVMETLLPIRPLAQVYSRPTTGPSLVWQHLPEDGGLITKYSFD